MGEALEVRRQPISKLRVGERPLVKHLHRIVQHDPVIVMGKVVLHDVQRSGSLRCGLQFTSEIEQHGERPLRGRLVDRCDITLESVHELDRPIGMLYGDALHRTRDPKPHDLVLREIARIELGKAAPIGENGSNNVDGPTQRVRMATRQHGFELLGRFKKNGVVRSLAWRDQARVRDGASPFGVGW